MPTLSSWPSAQLNTLAHTAACMSVTDHGAETKGCQCNQAAPVLHLSLILIKKEFNLNN